MSSPSDPVDSELRSIDPQSRKRRLRIESLARREAQSEIVPTSEQIFCRVKATGEYQSASTVMCYVSFGSEVSTRNFLASLKAEGKRAVIPYCVAGQLELFLLDSLDDLSPGTLGILEPRLELRGLPERRLHVEQLDLIVAPGVAFDRRCGRLGYGKGYYDRFLYRARPSTLAAAVAFECQLVDEVPVLAHDVRLDTLFTEVGVYQRGDRPRRGGSQHCETA